MNTKRLLALLLTLCMVFSLAVPGVAFAEDEETALLVEEGTPAETQDENPVIEEQPEETTQTPVVEEIIEENEQPAESVTDENEQPAENTDEQQTPEQPDENEQPALPILEAREEAQLGDPTVMTPSDFINAIANVTEYSNPVTVEFTNENVPGGNNHDDGYQIYLLGGYAPLRSTPITISNVTFDASEYTGNPGIQLYLYTSANVTFTNCTFNKVGVSFHGAEDKSPNSDVTATFTNCSFSNFNNYAIQYVRNATITGCTFTDCERAVMAFSHPDNYGVLKTLNISGNTFNGMVSKRIIKLYNLVTDSNSSITVQNNTLNNCTAYLFQVLKDRDNELVVNSHYKILGTNTGVTADNLSEPGSIPLYIEGNYYVDVLSANVAKIGETEYATLEDAIAAVPADGTETTITMIGDEAVVAGITVAADKNIVLELNGHKISGNTDSSTTYALITNRGTLTIQDNTDTNKNGTGSGLITTYITNPDTGDVPGYASNTITNNGTLTVKSGKIVNNGNGYACYAIDNQTNGNSYTPVVNIEGGRMEQMNAYTYAVRMFCNSTTNVNTLNVSGGVITGGYGLWLQTPNNKANKAVLNITGGEINAKDGAALYVGGTKADNSNISIDISDGVINGSGVIIQGPLSGTYGDVAISGGKIVNVQCGANVEDFISGGIYKNTPAQAYIADGFAVLDNDDSATKVDYPFMVSTAPATYVAKIGNTEYATLQEAFDAVQNGEIITLLADLTQDDGVQFNKADASAKFDLNGHTFTVNKGSNINSRAIRIDNGTLEVYNGSIVASGSGTTSSDGAGCYGAFRVEANGVLNAHNLTLTNSRPWGLNVKVLGGEATLENVTINSSYGGGIEVTETTLGEQSKPGKATLTNCNFNQSGYFDHCSTALSVSGGSELNVNGGTYTGEYALYVFSSGGVINVNGGTFTGLGNNNRAAIVAAIDLNTYPQYTGGLKISGGTFTGTYNITSPASLSITGGTYSADPSDYVADGYAAVKDGSVWKVGKVTIGDITSPTISEDTNEATYSVPVIVKDGDVTIETTTAQNIKVSVDTANDVASTRLSQISGLDNVVAAAVVSAGAQASDVTDIKVAVKSEVQASAASALTYEVHPEAIAYVNGTPAGNAVVITNDQIAGSTFTFKLDVTGTFGEGSLVKATHKSDGHNDDVKIYTVQKDSSNNLYILVTTTYFSTWTLQQGNTDDAVATYTIAGTRYYADNLADAFANVEAGGTVMLLKNIALTKAIDVDKQVTLDTNGKDITHATSGYTQDYLIGVKYGGDLTIMNNDSQHGYGWIRADASNVYCAIKMTLKGETYNGTPAKLTVAPSAGAIKGYYYGISGNGSRNGTEITINGGAITGGDVDNGTRGCGIYHPQNGTLTINSGTINGGETAVEMRAGTLNINGGLFTAIATPTATNPNGSGTTSSGAAIAIAQHTTKQPINVTITGGEFRGYSAFYESNPQNNGVSDISKISLSITGGEFKAVNGGSVAVYSEDAAANKINGFISGGSFSSIVENEYCAVGYIPKTEKVSGMYNVTEGWKITFNANGGTGTMGVQTIPANIATALTANAFTREGYTFDGWNTLADGKGTAYTDEQEVTLSADTTLYAQWKEEAPATSGTKIYTLNGVFGDFFVLNFYVETDVQNPTFFFVREQGNYELKQSATKKDFCEANMATFFVQKVAKGAKNDLGYTNVSGKECYMISVKFFTRYLDKTVTLSMKNGDEQVDIKGYKYNSIGNTEVKPQQSYSFTDYLQIMSEATGGNYTNLYNGLSTAAAAAWGIQNS